MKKIHDLFPLIKSSSWPDKVYIKSFDSQLGSLLTFVLHTLGHKVYQRQFQELRSSESTFFERDLFSESTKTLVIESLPSKMTLDAQQQLEHYAQDCKLVVVGSTPMHKEAEGWEQFNFFQIDQSFWNSLQAILADQISYKVCFSETISSLDKMIEVIKFQIFGIQLDDAYEGGIDTTTSSWPVIENLLTHHVAKNITQKQLLQTVHQLETLYQWLLSSDQQKKNFYIPLTLKKKIQKIGTSKVTKQRLWFYQFMESLAQFDYDSARFYLMCWSKSLR